MARVAVQAEISRSVTFMNGYHSLNVRSGALHFLLGFSSEDEAIQWLEVMVEAAGTVSSFPWPRQYVALRL